MTTGEKRNQLIAMTQTDYFCFVDDDDMISADYVSEMVKAMNQQPDVITFNGWMTTNGRDRKNFTIRLGEEYEERGGHFYRFPNHLCAFRRDLVRGIYFPHVWEQEDYQWARRIREYNLLRTEVHIDKDLYYYDFRTDKPPYSRIRVRRQN
jgi:GT2 family glycosyltransferase